MSEKAGLRKWRECFKILWGSRLYRAVLFLTVVCSYGFLVTNHTVGVDDTPFELYFEEGLNVVIGRWFLFVLNKIFHVADFAPFILDLAGALILMAAVVVWGVLLYSICGERVPLWGYMFFSCIFLSCPLLAEVYPYHLHNGVSVGYLCTGISLCFFRELSEDRKDWKKILKMALGMAFFLFVAIGCYESFMIVWLLGLLLVLLTERYMGIPSRIFTLLGIAGLSAVTALIMRSLMIEGLIGIFDLRNLRAVADQRTVGDVFGWVFETDAAAKLAMAFKRFYVMYFAFAFAYYPIRIFVAAAFFMGLYGLYSAIRRKCPWLFLLTAGCFICCILLVPVEGKATLYRAAQFLPVMCAYGAFLVTLAVGNLGRGDFRWKVKRGQKVDGEGKVWRKLLTSVSVFLLSVVLWNQCYEMNKWFYVDWLKYQSTLELARQINLALEKDFDISKPVVFIGNYAPPKSIVKDAYVGYNSETFYRIKRLTDPIDEHLLEKFYREYGVWVAQTPALSVFEWGVNAFESDEELVRFFAMHGMEIKANTEQAYFAEASEYFLEMPAFPQEGSIEDRGKYIIVRIQ